MQKVNGDECLSPPTIYEYFKQYKGYWEDLNNDERSDRLRSAVNEGNVEIMPEFIKKKSRNLRFKGLNGQYCDLSWCYKAFARAYSS